MEGLRLDSGCNPRGRSPRGVPFADILGIAASRDPRRKARVRRVHSGQTETNDVSPSLLPLSAETRVQERAPARPEAIRVVRINARLNVGGIPRHVAWLTAGLRAAASSARTSR